MATVKATRDAVRKAAFMLAVSLPGLRREALIEGVMEKVDAYGLAVLDAATAEPEMMCCPGDAEKMEALRAELGG